MLLLNKVCHSRPIFYFRLFNIIFCRWLELNHGLLDWKRPLYQLSHNHCPFGLVLSLLFPRRPNQTRQCTQCMYSDLIKTKYLIELSKCRSIILPKPSSIPTNTMIGLRLGQNWLALKLNVGFKVDPNFFGKSSLANRHGQLGHQHLLIIPTSC